MVSLKPSNQASLQELQELLLSWQEQKLDAHDPVRFCYLQTMVSKGLKHESASVKAALALKVSEGLEVYLKSYQSSLSNTNKGSEASSESLLTGLVQQLATSVVDDIPEPTGNAFEAQLKQQEMSLLGDAYHQDSKDSAEQESNSHDAPKDLSVMRDIRKNIGKQKRQRLVSRVIQERPENPGPINPQSLVIKSLSMARELSPSYANRLLSYLDSMLWLEQAGAKLSKGNNTRRK